MLTDADEAIRNVDMPERMQLAKASLRGSGGPVEAVLAPLIDPKDIPAAALWMSTRISDQLSASYLVRNQYGQFPPLRQPFLQAIEAALEQMCVQFYEVPFMWLHRRDYFVYHDPENPNEALRNIDLLGRAHLWRIQTLSIKYRALLDRKSALRTIWNRLEIKQGDDADHDDGYFDEFFASLESVEEASDLSSWLSSRYHKRMTTLRDDDLLTQADEDGAPTRLKRSAQVSRFAQLRSTAILAMAQVRHSLRWSRL